MIIYENRDNHLNSHTLLHMRIATLLYTSTNIGIHSDTAFSDNHTMFLHWMGRALESEYGTGSYSNCRCNDPMDGYISRNHIYHRKSYIFYHKNPQYRRLTYFLYHL